MVSRKKKPDCFGWFRLSNYGGCAKFGPLQWHQQLTLRQMIAPFIAPQYAFPGAVYEDPDRRQRALDAWLSIKQNGAGCDLQFIEWFDFGRKTPSENAELRGVRPLQFREVLELEVLLEQAHGADRVKEARSQARETLRDVLSGRSSFRLWMNEGIGRNVADALPHGIANVDLTVSDSLLFEAFKVWLHEARTAWKKEREASTKLTAEHIVKFARARTKKTEVSQMVRIGLLPAIDLLLQGAESGKKISNNSLATMMGRGPRSADATRKTVRRLAESFLIGDARSCQLLRDLEVQAMNLLHG